MKSSEDDIILSMSLSFSPNTKLAIKILKCCLEVQMKMNKLTLNLDKTEILIQKSIMWVLDNSLALEGTVTTSEGEEPQLVGFPRLLQTQQLLMLKRPNVSK